MNVFKQFRIEPDLLDKVKQLSKRLGLSVSAWIRLAIIEKIRRGEK